MKRLYVMLLTGILLLSCLEMKGAEWKWIKNKKKAKTEQADTLKKKKVSKYDKLLKKPGIETAKGDFITIHKAGKKIYFEYPVKYLGREVLLGSTLKTTSNAFFLPLGYKSTNTLHLKFELQDSTIRVVQPNIAAFGDDKNENIKKRFERGYTPVLYKSYPMVAYNNDSTAVVFEVTNLFQNDDLIPKNGMVGPIKEKKETFSFGSIKAFEDNVSVEVEQNFTTTLQIIIPLPMEEITTKSTISLLLLPENKMCPRIWDNRVGVFFTANRGGIIPLPKFDISSQGSDGYRAVYFTNRWRIEPVDQAAWERGETVEVKKPIVWYVDNAFPEAWRAPIKEGVLIWNKAFEEIGLKNVLQVRDFPTIEEDSVFDPDNLKYSCIRYVPSNIQNAMGPSWTDPVTGEILNASVIIWHDIVKLVTDWRFIQTAQVDERVRGKKLPPEVLHEALVYVSAHEIGHTLGLMHNMGASHAYPVDSLRSATFTAKYGTTPSIMDYARNNYVAQPEDKGVKLTPPDLGLYDEYVIKWLYSPIAGNKTMWEEKDIIEKWVDEKAGDPIYRYGMQQFRDVYDPSSLSEDLGDDPVKAGTYGIKNLKYILPNLETWSGEKGDIIRRDNLYRELVNQYYRYLTNVFYQIGGVYLANVKDGTAGKPYEPVSRNDQKRAVNWLIKELRSCSWLDNRELAGKLRPGQKQSYNIQQNILRSLLGEAPGKVIVTSHLAQYQGQAAYTLKDYCNDLYTEAFRPTLQGKTLNMMDRSFQQLLIKGIGISTGTPPAPAKKAVSAPDNFTADLSAYPSLEELRLSGLVPRELLDHFRVQFEEAEKNYGKGAVAKSLLPYLFGDTNGLVFGIQVSGSQNELAEVRLSLLKKINALAKSKMNTAPMADRLHYELLYRETQKALKID